MRKLIVRSVACGALAVLLTALLGISSAIAKSSPSRDGFWTKSVQDAPDLEPCREAVLQRANDPVANNDYGWALRMHGDLAEAAKYLQRAIEIDPQLSQAYSNLSVVMLEQGNIDQAVSTARKAVVLQPQQPVYRVVLGNALTKQNNLDEAIEEYKTAIRLKSDYENAHYHLGLALSTKGENVAATQELSLALKFDPEDERAEILLDKLTSITPANQTHQSASK